MPASRDGPPETARTVPGVGRSHAAEAPGMMFPIVAIGASAGGLEACRKLFAAMPPAPGMAFVLVQHLDPDHPSLMPDLLSAHTAMTVTQAEDGVRLEPDHVYIIGPGTFLSVSGGALVVSRSPVRHARLPFDVLLNALAAEEGLRAICVVLSGSGDDGSSALGAVKAAGGAVIAQDPEEAGYEGMPRAAIATGHVDLVLPLAKMPAALAKLARERGPPEERAAGPETQTSGTLAAIVDLIHNRTGHDFRLYKPGTLQRRIQRRMALATIRPDGMEGYLATLLQDPVELETLARDLLIHVTSFFRDPAVFHHLGSKVAPEMIKDRSPDDPIRIWVAGCSTGEEAYGIAMVFLETIAASGRDVKLQVFASDVDPGAVATAREGLYPSAMEAPVSAARLAQFFVKEEHGYRVSPELRATVVFTSQNLLFDPPFSRLDLISCRNLLIYLRPEAQAKAVSVFHFALKPGGVLLLGASESVGRADGRFAVLSKPARLYRRIGKARPTDFGFPSGGGGLVRRPGRVGTGPSATVPASFAELTRRLVLETHAPAAVLINRARECVYSLGPTDRYLRVAAGVPSLDLLAMARHGIRAKLAEAITRAFEQNAVVRVQSGPVTWEGRTQSFDIEARPVRAGGEPHLLLCFLDTSRAARGAAPVAVPEDTSRIQELEAELGATRAELRSALRGLEIANEEQTTVNEEALSVNEEYQSTNEELITSKEELQSLNEELNALNSQLQETLDRQRTTASDLQNILYSTDLATVFLDRDLKIRFFTPATRALFNIIPGDVGRPLTDLRAMAPDAELIDDAKAMLMAKAPVDREIEVQGGTWFMRRIMPYRTHGGAVEGLVIMYGDITGRKLTASRLEAATTAAQVANRAKSRFLASASHDLRQPLQTLTLIQGLMLRKAKGEEDRKLVRLQEQCLAAMSGMLNTLLDINQIDAGVVQPKTRAFPINEMFDRLRDEFTYHAQAKGLILRVAPCSLSIVSDPALLEQIIRNLLTNAVKYTARGKILLGCRRRGSRLRIQVLDTGMGIAGGQLELIFEEYHQVENIARERSRGLGLGLSIVQRLAALLGHNLAVRSMPRKGSVFAIDVDRAPPPPRAAPGGGSPPALDTGPASAETRPTGAVLLVEDDPEVRELLRLVLAEAGHRVTQVADGASALEAVEHRGLRPDLVLADYNLPGGVTGLELAARLRGKLGGGLPVLVLTGDISTDTLREITAAHCELLHKPAKPDILLKVIDGLLAGKPVDAAPLPALSGPRWPARIVVFVVDDDAPVRDALRAVMEAAGLAVETFADCEAFLAFERPAGQGCLLVDAYLPGGMTGLDLIRRLREAGDETPAIMITGEADVEIAVEAMKAGAADFIEKPVTGPALLDSLGQVLEKSQDASKMAASRAIAAGQLGKLTRRQREILDRVLAGQPSKNIAADLGISQRTVENHRAAIMHKTGSKSLPALARLAVSASENVPPPSA